MLLNFNHLYYFHVAAVEGSVAAAAQRLGVTQPTVSEQLRTLEQTIGSTLFDRTPSGLRLTNVGRLAVVHTARFFSASGQLVKALTVDTSSRTSLRIGLSAALSRSLVNEWLLVLLGRRDLIVQARTGDSLELVRALRTGALDLVLCELVPSDEITRGLANRLIQRERLVVVAAPTIGVTGDWSASTIVRFPPTSPHQWMVTEFLDARGLHPRVVAESEDILFLVDAAIRCRHLAIVPESAVRQAVADRQLRIIEIIEVPGVAISALYQDNCAAVSAIDSLLVNSEYNAQL